MCIIIAKNAGIAPPTKATIKNCWEANPDGAGIMYQSQKGVTIEKGFMSLKALDNRLNALESEIDTTKTPIVYHFRIGTSGGNTPENTHPFPITDSIGALKKLRTSCRVGVAHNGIIHIYPRKGISDTMEYILSQLSIISRINGKFYNDARFMDLISNAISSKMAFLPSQGEIKLIGKFTEDGGLFYSNDTYLPSKYGSYYYKWKKGDHDYLNDKFDWETWEKSTIPLAWLDSDKEYLADKDGAIIEADGFLIDCRGTIYEYDWDYYLARERQGLRRIAENGATLTKWEWDKTEYFEVGK